MENEIGKTTMELGKFKVYEELGRGGYGTVYRAYDITLKVERAVKILHPALTADLGFIERFQREAQVAARLEHPHIVPVYDIGEDGGYYYLVMKYMAGGSLKELLEKNGRLPYQTALEMAGQIGSALEKAHGAGLVHRDVKPGNILLEEGGVARLADFGFARAMQGASSITLSRTGGLAGTPAYMAPELWNDMEATPATDLYSLACVFYEMLFGEMLFDGKTPTGIMKKHVMEQPRFPVRWPQGVPDGFEGVLGRALAKEPGERYQTVGEFLDGLRKLGIYREKAVQEKREVETEAEGYNAWKKCEKCDSIYFASLTCCPHCQKETDGRINNNSKESEDGSAGEKNERKKIGLLLVGAAVIVLMMIPIVFQSGELMEGIATKETEVKRMEMAIIPAGEFEMGSTEGESDEEPVHTVYLDSFWIDRTEVTNAMYVAFLNTKGNQIEEGVTWLDDEGKYVLIIQSGGSWQPKSGYDNYPVVEVSWYGANAYCEWVGKRLPSEAEWEKAARGTDGRNYPWGNGSPSEELLNYADLNMDADWADESENDGYEFSAPVGSYPAGVSPYGVLDMAGNVYEWVNDWYNENYYSNSPKSSPNGPSDGTTRVVRGGSWGNDEFGVLSAYRNWSEPDLTSNFIGFRCAASAASSP